MRGVVFDIKSFALNDGEGIRTTVFLKGCPLRCAWCHNPEGLSPKSELYQKVGCADCGLCRRPCDHADCAPHGRCLHICPKNLLRQVGVEWDTDDLAAELLKKSDIYEMTGGGITLSGGEPLMQPEFSLELLKKLQGRVHRAIETSGYARKETFMSIIQECDFVYMDLKLCDREEHKKYTGVYNDRIIENAYALKDSGIPHKFRIPLVAGITDTEENLRGLSEIIGDSQVELLSYNILAPAKYKCVGREFSDLIDGERPVNAVTSLFKSAILRK